ncbi:MAG: hypothetical protein H6721_24010 [Sandaracinus sp.]|nr:hypothetical protein [Myxococcales bacterium]MCB9604778.1 hypothetical protein [Sandaracinus sp.]MCB9616273.1 hypothetical protein [Sandaracinus sp.]MCB9617985.1 hypothetical protein [Sandaracinus sp.]MCB9635198.1 hypothetical protein [Sandaracinus sp.]
MATDDTPSVLEREVRAVVERVASRHEGARVGVLVLDPRDGRVVVAAGSGVLGDDEPLRRAPTGSTFKAVTLAAALGAGLDPSRVFDGAACCGVRDAHPRAQLDPRTTIVHSSNVGTARIVETVGADPIVALVDSLAWNEAFELGGRHADAALVPHDDPEMHAHFASGIGTEATLLHLASAYAAIANGGEWIAPTTRGDGTRRRVMDAQVSATLLGFLEDAVREGTGQRARVEGVRVAGKTGTVPNGDATYSLFVGLAPVDAPTRVIAVRVEALGDHHGGSAAAPVFAELWPHVAP